MNQINEVTQALLGIEIGDKVLIHDESITGISIWNGIVGTVRKKNTGRQLFYVAFYSYGSQFEDWFSEKNLTLHRKAAE